MARRSKRSSFSFFRGTAKILLGLNVTAAVVLGGWYLTQPHTRQGEVRRLVVNALEREKRVSALDVGWDVWQLYYSDSSAGRIATGDKAIVYGGVPRMSNQGAGAKTIRVLSNSGYVVGYSDAIASPLWAAYRVQDMRSLPTPAPRPEKFEIDRRTAARVAPDAFAGTGYDRGHLAPNYAIATRYGAKAQRETFLMSNITPQLHAFNAGTWRSLEMKIATSYPARYGEVWVLTGPVFGDRPRQLRGGMFVPEAFFLIVVDENEERLRTLSLLVPHDAAMTSDVSQYLTSIDELQRRTGLDFLSELDDASEREIEQARATRMW
jgi:endonuclease G, mitochondrial